MAERILTGHAKGDAVYVDWHDGRGPRRAVIVRRQGGCLHIRFPGEARNRKFAPHSEPRGLWVSPKGQIVEVSR